jgi:hypothetical protein
MSGFRSSCRGRHTDIALGRTKQDEIYACHELETYPDDRLTCAGGGAMILLAGEGRNAIDVYKVTLPAPRRAGGGR